VGHPDLILADDLDGRTAGVDDPCRLDQRLARTATMLQPGDRTAGHISFPQWSELGVISPFPAEPTRPRRSGAGGRCRPGGRFDPGGVTDTRSEGSKSRIVSPRPVARAGRAAGFAAGPGRSGRWRGRDDNGRRRRRPIRCAARFEAVGAGRPGRIGPVAVMGAIPAGPARVELLGRSHALVRPRSIRSAPGPAARAGRTSRPRSRPPSWQGVIKGFRGGPILFGVSATVFYVTERLILESR
jgi:hypothetical protein